MKCENCEEIIYDHQPYLNCGKYICDFCGETIIDEDEQEFFDDYDFCNQTCLEKYKKEEEE